MFLRFTTMHWRARVGRSVAALAVVMGLSASCAPVPSGNVSTQTGSTSAPERVASAYVNAIMAGDFAGASTYVVTEHRDIIKALGLGPSSGTLTPMAGDLRVGKVTVTGNTASAVLVGQMCRSGAGPSGGEPAAGDCVENHDVQTDSPIFRVGLRRVGTEWQVALPIPPREAG